MPDSSERAKANPPARRWHRTPGLSQSFPVAVAARQPEGQAHLADGLQIGLVFGTIDGLAFFIFLSGPEVRRYDHRQCGAR